jgi:nucleotide-binding universal stress UspA family protein
MEVARPAHSTDLVQEHAMYASIVVPLDGSPFSERALPLALALGRRLNAEVELVHVHEYLPDEEGREGREPDPGHALVEQRGRFSRLAERLAARSRVSVSSTVLAGRAADAIPRWLEDGHSKLVIMATHGRSRMGRLLMGSVADAVIRHVHAPVLVVRAGHIGTADPLAAAPIFRRVIVPLDGSELAEAVVAHALAVGDDAGTEYSLVTIVTTPPVMRQAFRPTMAPRRQEALERAVADARRYAEHIADEMRRCGSHVRTRVIVHENPASAILALAGAERPDLIALSTHGRGAVRRAWFGSVADEILRRARVPLLLLRPPASALRGEPFATQESAASRMT